MTHYCELPNCDGTDLGHKLAQDFPSETQRVRSSLDDLLDRLHNPDDYVRPENLQVEGEA